MQKPILSKNDVLKNLVIAVDGPAGSGKSTTARLVASALGLRHIDTGAMYRAVTLLALREDVNVNDGEKLEALARSVKIEFEDVSVKGQLVRMNGEDVSQAIRTPQVTQAVSAVSAVAQVRAAMVGQQRYLAAGGRVVLEGRDIGTVVLPDADVKIYLVASTRVRAQRRLKDLKRLGVRTTVDAVEADIMRRDQLDSSRESSPLQKAVGAAEVDTSDLTIEGQVERIVAIAGEMAERIASLIPPPGTKSRVQSFKPHYLLGTWLIRLVTTVLFGLQVRWHFRPDLEENYIFACNHLAYADPPFVGATLPREVHFVAKATLFDNPVFARLIRAFNAIPLRRGIFDREAMGMAVDLLKRGRSLMIFPEGARVYGGRLGKPKRGIGYLAIHSGVAVIPVYVSGTNRLRRCLLRRDRIRVEIGKPIRLHPRSTESLESHENYRAFSKMVMEAIAALKDGLDRPAP